MEANCRSWWICLGSFSPTEVVLHSSAYQEICTVTATKIHGTQTDPWMEFCCRSTLMEPAPANLLDWRRWRL